MLILDTDHFSEFVRQSEIGKRLKQRLETADDDTAISVITLDEQARGWLAAIRQAKTGQQTISTYAKLQQLFEVAGQWKVLPWNDDATSIFEAHLGQKTKMGTMDLRIAAIAIANGGRLLSRNLKDFNRIEGLDVEDWLA